jgi:hypothetical protein
VGDTGHMRTRGGPIIVWLLATAAAIAVASLAIGQVGRQVTLDAPLDQQLAQAAAEPDAVSTDTVPAPSDAPDPAPDPAPADTDEAVHGDASSEADPDPDAAAIRTYDAIGGSAAIVVDGDTVDLRWATPRDGFRASVERSPAGNELRIDFRSEAHRSRIKVQVVDGRVLDEVEEDDR